MVRLRRWETTDLACVRAASEDGRISDSTTVPRECSEDAGRAWIERQHRRTSDGEGWSWAICDAATDRAVDLSSSWGLEHAGLARIEAWVEPGNESSIRLLERCGFQPEGRLRSFLTMPTHRSDALVYSRIAAR